MDNSHTFTTFWSGQVPFIASCTLQQLRLWVSSNPWFADHDHGAWFDLPNSTLDRLQMEYQLQWLQLGQKMLTGQPFSFDDRRFASANWNNPVYGSLAAFYLLNAGFLIKLVNELAIAEEKPRLRLLYLVEQSIAAAAPSNFLACNPDALQRAADTQGASLVTGLQHLASDLQEGKLRQCDSAAFKVGVDLAITPGEIVFENELFQLIQYYPQSETQFKRPLLMVPPSINKYYILDLRPENSVIRHLLEQGHPVFLMSWRNFDSSTAGKTWDDLVEDGVIAALQTTRQISGEQQINCMGFCIGGTLLSCALAVLAARGDKQISSVTLLTTFLDYQDTGTISIFVDEKQVAQHERTIGGINGPVGLFRGEDMGNTFSLLRPNELWWNYNVDKYLKGQKPVPFDLLFWNNDSTNLPGPMYCWYLRHTYLQNDLKSGDLDCCGVKLDLHAIDAPAYIYASREDHIVPWRSAYANTAILNRETRFVLGASGHIAGVINPPANNKRHYWTNDQLPNNADNWLAEAQQHPGSWWGDWCSWLAERSGERRAAVTELGNDQYPLLEPAPGRYVMQ
ncbi:class I poly(R)-hydroxyalkanoic acid synthase [Pseudomonas putida]